MEPIQLQILCSYGSKVGIPTEIWTNSNNNTATVIFKFKYKIMVTSYLLVNGIRKCHLRPVLLEGSNDSTWSEIHDAKLRQSHEESLPRENIYIECPSSNNFFSTFRFTFPGRSVNLLAIEFYGVIMEMN